ncbi:putative ATP:guanido phosphotransferase [bacterium BMS3Abin05]|nr:putative ATP:guanido phosphotransferase [bacterium BMS3Abin05]GBE27375.1 putative ATP:guanido phosphotransferase [bacterium BMS3Bbin03]HDZ12706.1 protein arginine kinase [Bacteroidota bacterium]
MALDFDNLVFKSPPWLNCKAPDSDVVLSCRVRLARNLRDTPFPNRAANTVLQQIFRQVETAYSSVDFLENALFLDMGDLSNTEHQILAERHVISPEFVMKKIPTGLVLDETDRLSLMVNEEDHLRIQALESGFRLEELWDRAEQIDRQLGSVLEYAFSEELGFLTACPTNTGTGLRVSFFVHLPALAMMERLDSVLRNKPPSGLSVRGFYGEGSDVVGHLYQISNQFTLGWTEWRILEDIEETAVEIIEQERAARQELLEEDRIHLENRVFRSIGILERAKIMSSYEFIEHFSTLKLGILTGLLPKIDHQTLNDLLVQTQPEHIQKIAGRGMKPLERDIFRMEFIRSRLNF